MTLALLRKRHDSVRVLQNIDIAVRHAESFAAIQDAIAQLRHVLIGACMARGSYYPSGFYLSRTAVNAALVVARLFARLNVSASCSE